MQKNKPLQCNAHISIRFFLSNAFSQCMICTKRLKWIKDEMQKNVIEGAEKHFLQNFIQRADCIAILKESLKNFQWIQKGFQKEFQRKFIWILSEFLKILEQTTVEFSNNSETILKPSEFHQNSRKLGSFLLKFVYSEKATKFCEISTKYFTGRTMDK